MNIEKFKQEIKSAVFELVDEAVEGHGIEPQKWIPCNEGEPQNDGRYLVTDKDGMVLVMEYSHGGWVMDGFITAWMEYLPKPYKEDEE